MKHDFRTQEILWKNVSEYENNMKEFLNSDVVHNYPEIKAMVRELKKKANDCDVELFYKYKNISIPYVTHVVGLDEFCKLEGIDKIVYL